MHNALKLSLITACLLLANDEINLANRSSEGDQEKKSVQKTLSKSYIISRNIERGEDANTQLSPLSHETVEPSVELLEKKDPETLVNTLNTPTQKTPDTNFVSDKFEVNGDIIESNTPSFVNSSEGYIQANSIVYNKETQCLEASGDVYGLKNDKSYFLTDYANIHLPTKNGNFDKFFFSDAVGGMWTRSVAATSQDNVYLLNDAISSGCNPSSPAWRLKYTTGTYDRNNQYVSLWNARLYAGEVPLFYLPYFAFPTDKTRRSGLLIPYFGYLQREGFVYMQPYYIAPSPSWDVELSPQIRTSRGKGIGATLRFADSLYSKGSLTAGIFQDTSAYQKDAASKYTSIASTHTSHYGLEGHYERSRVFSTGSTPLRDGIYADFKTMNDSDYINLKSFDVIKNYSNLLVSRANYFADWNENFVGVYGRFYQNMTIRDNSQTIQTLPSVQYHRSSTSLFTDKLLYTFDFKSSNFTRNEGVTAIKNQMFLPITYNQKFFDDYLGLQVTQAMFASQTTFADGTADLSPYKTYGQYQQVQLSSNLLKPYESFVHGVKLFVGYTHPSTVIEKGLLTVPTELKGAVAETQQKESLQIGLTQYYFGYDGKPIFSHRLAQLVSYSADPTQRYNDIQNEFIYTPNSFLTLSTDTYYSHELARLRSATTSATIKYGDFSGRLSNIYKDQVGTIDTNYYSAGISYAINPKLRLRSDYDYDVAQGVARRKGIGIFVDKGCWSYDLSYREENLLGYPQMSKIIYLQLRLIPLGGLNQKYVVGGI